MLSVDTLGCNDIFFLSLYCSKTVPQYQLIGHGVSRFFENAQSCGEKRPGFRTLKP